MLTKKTCSQCGREVPESSKMGENCPHCGAYWSDEKEYKRIPSYEPSEEVIRRNLWREHKEKIGDKISQQEKDALAEIAMMGRIEYVDQPIEGSYFIIEDGHVIELNIYALSVFPDSLFNLTGLKRFFIHVGTMPSIPDRLDEFKELLQLTMVFSTLNEFPESFGRMPKLTSLHITYGSIPKFPSNFGKTSKLRELIIDTPEINIQNVSSVLGEIPSLEILKLRRLYLNFLPDRMRNHQKLKKLAIYDNDGPLELEDGFTELNNLELFNCCQTPLKNLTKLQKAFIKQLKKNKAYSHKDIWEEISLSE